MTAASQSLKLFLSYTGSDQAWAEWIAWRLEAAGHQAILQAWDFRPGENFVVSMRRALDDADRTLAVVSAAYLKSVYGSDEWTAAFVHDRPDTMSLLMIRVEDVALPRLLRPWLHIDLTGLDAETAAQRLLEGVQPERLKPNEPPAFPLERKAGGPIFPGLGPAIWNLPPRNPAFVGRHNLLAQLRAHLGLSVDQAGPVAVVAQALYGLGGVGKTQVALEYAHRYAADYDLVWWIPSENPLMIPAALARLAPKLGLTVTADQEEVVVAVLDALRARERWLLVFDNARQPDDLARWQPPGHGHVVVTSRSPAWGAFGRAVRVDVLPREDAVDLLLRRTLDYDRASADALAEAVGDLPLALEQAAAYLEQTGMPLAAYLSAYGRRRERLLAKGRAIAYHGQVDTTWQLNIDRVALAGVELLRLCAFLAPEAIPLDLFNTEPERLPRALAAAVAEEGEAGVQEAAGAGYRYSLVDRDGSGVRVHRLVQQVVRARLAEPDRRAIITTVIELLAVAFPSSIDEFADVNRWPRCAELLPHLLAAAEHAQAHTVAESRTANLLRRAGTYLERRGEYTEARGLLERALALTDTGPGSDDLEVAYILGTLGYVLRSEGDLVGARAHLERALTIGEKVLAPNHPDLGVGLNTLGVVLREQGDLVGARVHLERAIAAFEAALGTDHFWVGVGLGNLGLVLCDEGDLVGARAHLERALALHEAAFGPHHPDVGRAIRMLGIVLREQGDLVGARAHLERAIDSFEAALGFDHLEVGITCHWLGRVLQSQGDLAGARAHLERAYACLEAGLGSAHPHTQAVARELARL
jgi:tetratricopeptide (TPR) repeat protein